MGRDGSPGINGHDGLPVSIELCLTLLPSVCVRACVCACVFACLALQYTSIRQHALTFLLPSHLPPPHAHTTEITARFTLTRRLLRAFLADQGSAEDRAPKGFKALPVLQGCPVPRVRLVQRDR